jgi:hypothetical protein
MKDGSVNVELTQNEIISLARYLARYWFRQFDDSRSALHCLAEGSIDPQAAKVQLLTLREKVDKALSYCDMLRLEGDLEPQK